MYRRTPSLAVVVVLTAGAPLWAAAPLYTVTDLGILPGGDTSYATGINNFGQVVGYANDSRNYTHDFLYNGSGPIVDLGALADSSGIFGSPEINNAGLIVGSYNPIPTKAFTWTSPGPYQT